jgi:hypothetical protein
MNITKLGHEYQLIKDKLILIAEGIIFMRFITNVYIFSWLYGLLLSGKCFVFLVFR